MLCGREACCCLSQGVLHMLIDQEDRITVMMPHCCAVCYRCLLTCCKVPCLRLPAVATAGALTVVCYRKGWQYLLGSGPCKGKECPTLSYRSCVALQPQWQEAQPTQPQHLSSGSQCAATLWFEPPAGRRCRWNMVHLINISTC